MENTKTAEEIYLETLYKDRGIPSDSPLANKWMGDFRKSLEYHDTIRAITAATQLCSEQNTALKKRIEELETQTTLYGVCFYSWDGGGSNSTLYRTIEEARSEMILEVNKKQKEKDMMEADEDGLKDYWHAIDENAWTDGFENIAIQTYTIINFS